MIDIQDGLILAQEIVKSNRLSHHTSRFRIKVLSTALHDEGHKVTREYRLTSKLCEFSGGGDIYIHVNSTVVLGDNGIDDDDLELSPRQDDDEILSGSIIEGKARDATLPTIKHQLMANMVILVTKVILDNDYSIVSCYGVVLTSSGEFGLKLVVDFNKEEMKFYRKIPVS